MTVTGTRFHILATSRCASPKPGNQRDQSSGTGLSRPVNLAALLSMRAARGLDRAHGVVWCWEP